MNKEKCEGNKTVHKLSIYTVIWGVSKPFYIRRYYGYRRL